MKHLEDVFDSIQFKSFKELTDLIQKCKPSGRYVTSHWEDVKSDCSNYACTPLQAVSNLPYYKVESDS